MAPTTPPSFDEWVEYCFVHGHRDFMGETEDAREAVDARIERFERPDKPWLTDYLTRLFEAPAYLADRFTDEQIGRAVWFLFGVGSGYMNEVRAGAANPDAEARCIRSVATMYTDLFDRVCGVRGTQPDANLYNHSEVDIAVYMIWDMDTIQYIAMFPEESPHLVEPAMYVLETVLAQCVTSSCIISALHGIGHLLASRQRNDDTAMVTRLQMAINGLLARRRLPAWLEEYATYARDGAVM